MRLKISTLLILAMCITGCGDDHYAFRGERSADGGVSGSFTITRGGLYSVAIESDVDAKNRVDVFRYFRDFKNRKPVSALVNIDKNDGRSRTRIIEAEVVNPTPSSWSASSIYSELVRVKLESGSYEMSMRFKGVEPAGHDFIDHIIIERAYSGK